jgi:hypothetical protein
VNARLLAATARADREGEQYWWDMKRAAKRRFAALPLAQLADVATQLTREIEAR